MTVPFFTFYLGSRCNKTVLQPVSKPVEQILGFYGPIYKKGAKNGANVKLNVKLNGCFVGKTSLTKNFQIISWVGGGSKL